MAREVFTPPLRWHRAINDEWRQTGRVAFHGPLAQIRLNYRVQLPAEVVWGSCLHMPFETTGGDASLLGPFGTLPYRSTHPAKATI